MLKFILVRLLFYAPVSSLDRLQNLNAIFFFILPIYLLIIYLFVFFILFVCVCFGGGGGGCLNPHLIEKKEDYDQQTVSVNSFFKYEAFVKTILYALYLEFLLMVLTETLGKLNRKRSAVVRP
jgi:hypothetical protein